MANIPVGNNNLEFPDMKLVLSIKRGKTHHNKDIYQFKINLTEITNTATGSFATKVSSTILCHYSLGHPERVVWFPKRNTLEFKEDFDNFNRDTDWDMDIKYINEEQSDQDQQQQILISPKNISQILSTMDRKRKLKIPGINTKN